jgi:hypothetical protein
MNARLARRLTIVLPVISTGVSAAMIVRAYAGLWADRKAVLEAAPRLMSVARPLKPIAGSGDLVEVAVPAQAAPEAERRIFLSPGGMYTAADIKANGSQLPSQRFAGQLARHTMVVRKGELMCPVTQTRADPRFTWIVGGKSYRFCCPPCVANFVQQAKTKPESIKDPQAYLKRGSG